MSCNCNKPKCDGKCGISPSVLQINNPGDCTLFHRVEVPASMGDSTTNPPKNGDYRNVLLYYVADGTSWLFSSDGVPQKLVSGFTDYEDAINLPSINGVTLLRNKTGEELGLQNKLTAGDGIEISSNDTISVSNIEQYAHFFDTVANMKTSVNLADGSYARTMGFHSLNDGGKALYKIRTATGDDTPNEIDMISIGDGSLVAILMENKNVNIKQLGAYGDNTHDDKAVIQHAIDTYDVIYFPYGNYLISDGLTASRSIILRGDSKLSLPYNGSFIHMTKANTTLLVGDSNATHIDLESMGFVSTSSNVTVDEDLHVRPSEPYNPYHYNETVAGCNGVSATKKLKVTNCYFTGFSGYAVQANNNAMITDTLISHSNNGIRVNGHDPIITRPYITLCKNGIYMVSGSSSSIFMYDIWIDQIVEYGIKASGIVGVLNGIIDHVGYCGIYATGNCKVNLDMRIGRCGMYYASVEDPTTITNENMIYACSMYLTNIVDSQLKVTYEYRDIGTSTSTTAYMLPKCVLFVKQFIRSLFTAMNVDSSVELIRVTNYNNSNGTIITQEGIKKWDSATRQFVDIYTLAP